MFRTICLFLHQVICARANPDTSAKKKCKQPIGERDETVDSKIILQIEAQCFLFLEMQDQLLTFTENKLLFILVPNHFQQQLIRFT